MMARLLAGEHGDDLADEPVQGLIRLIHCK